MSNIKIKNLARELANQMNLIQATNHKGWEIQILTRRGWKNEVLDTDLQPKIFQTRAEAQKMLDSFNSDDQNEYRVYEVMT